jgi:hydroxyethylthiazole kinase-like uncharacterized protein yjeF
MSCLELLSPDQMAEADRLTITRGTSGFALMQRAGVATAAAAARMAPGADVLVFAGPGNNGGDGLIAASELRRRGHAVHVVVLGERGHYSGDAGLAAASYDGSWERFAPGMEFSAGLIIDALLGAGLTRALDGNAAAAVEAINASGAPVLAVDLPSGVDGGTGEVRGAAVTATRTVTFFRLKPGHLLLPGRTLCGETELAQIGIPDEILREIRPSVFRNDPTLWRAHLQPPAPGAHKYLRGHAFVVSGPAYATGAARLAAAAALRTGAGLVTVLSPPDAVLVNAAQLTAIMVRPFDHADDIARILADPRAGAVVIGPGNGVGTGTRENVEAALATGIASVLDADALTSFADEPQRLFELIGSGGGPVVLTPHEGEFGRLFKAEGPKIERARAAAQTSGAVVVLKGPDTVIAAPDGRLAINANATADLATAGSGDVLAGMIAGLLAQGVPAFEAAAAAVWIHGAAGAALGRGLIAEDLPAAIPAVLQSFGAGNAPASRSAPA